MEPVPPITSRLRWGIPLGILFAAALALGIGRVLTGSCGLQVFGHVLTDRCGSRVDVAQAAILAETRVLEQALAARPACRAWAPLPEPAGGPTQKAALPAGRIQSGSVEPLSWPGDPGDKALPVESGRLPPGMPPGAGAPSPGDGAPACLLSDGPQGGVVLVMDGSTSMRRPYGIAPAQEQALDRRMQSPDPVVRAAAAKEQEALAGAPGEKRIDLTRRVLGEAVAQAGHRARLVTFSKGCQVRAHGPEEAADVIRTLQPDGSTPLARAIQRAADLVPAEARAPWQIVLVTDGYDTCKGNPCLAARTAKKAHPTLAINVVDLSGAADLGCVAEATGGRLYRGGDSVDLAPVLREAMAPAACGASAPNASREGG